MACIQADFHAVCFIFIRKKGADAQFELSLLGYITWQQVRPPIRLKVIPFPPLPLLVHAFNMLSWEWLNKGFP